MKDELNVHLPCGRVKGVVYDGKMKGHCILIQGRPHVVAKMSDWFKNDGFGDIADYAGIIAFADYIR